MPHEERASTSIILDNAYDYIKALQVRQDGSSQCYSRAGHRVHACVPHSYNFAGVAQTLTVHLCVRCRNGCQCSTQPLWMH